MKPDNDLTYSERILFPNTTPDNKQIIFESFKILKKLVTIINDHYNRDALSPKDPIEENFYNSIIEDIRVVKLKLTHYLKMDL